MSATPANDLKLREMLKDLYHLVRQVQEERTRGEHTLQNISKTHEKMQLEQKASPYYKTKLRGLYTTAQQDAESESSMLQQAVEKVAEIKGFKQKGVVMAVEKPKPPGMRRGVLMTLLQKEAVLLPVWQPANSRLDSKPPPLCGAIPADPAHVVEKGKMVAAHVKGQDGEENWILAEVVSFNSGANKYEVDDIDSEEGKERHNLSRRRVVPLPVYKADPERHPEAIFPKGTLVLALYPQTTCFYRATIHEPPRKGVSDEYSVLFEDTSYAEGYSPPLCVAQRYVIACKEGQ